LDAQALLDVARATLALEADALLAARERIDGAFVSAAQIILGRCPPGKVAVMGVGKSGHVGHKIAATLASTGTPAFFVHPTEAGHGDLGMIAHNDVALAISYSGKSDELLRVLPYLKRHDIPLIAITGNAGSPLAEYADCHLDGTVAREACPLGLAPTASTTLALALGDALAICLLRQRGFTPDDFAITHPHGALGRKLLVTVADIMLKGAEIPKVFPETSIRQSLVEMSRGGIGITAITSPDGKVLGVYTDGDLRRTLDSNLDIFNTPIGTVMGRQPIVMQAGRLAVEAAELMEHHKVGAILVVDEDGHLVGALNMRILLKAGVV